MRATQSSAISHCPALEKQREKDDDCCAKDRNHIDAAATVARVEPQASDRFRHAYTALLEGGNDAPQPHPKHFSEDRRYLFAFKYETRLLATYAPSASGFEACALGAERTRAMDASARLISR